MTASVMVGMSPGRDGRDWSLCRVCWADGFAVDVAEPEVEAVTAEVLPMQLGRMRKDQP